MKFKEVGYVAGPYSSSSNGRSVEDNIIAARDLAVWLWENGFVALCPHMNTAGFETYRSVK